MSLHPFRGVHTLAPAAYLGIRGCSGAPCILVTIGQESRVYHAFVMSAPCHLDAPSTVTLHVSTFGDVAGFAADEVALDEASARVAGRIVLVDALDQSGPDSPAAESAVDEQIDAGHERRGPAAQEDRRARPSPRRVAMRPIGVSASNCLICSATSGRRFIGVACSPG